MFSLYQLKSNYFSNSKIFIIATCAYFLQKTVTIRVKPNFHYQNAIHSKSVSLTLKMWIYSYPIAIVIEMSGFLE